MGRWTEALAGIGLGLVVGLLMGLSTASVVGGVIAALAAGLAAFLGLVPNVAAERTVRIGAFGLACALGVLAGLAVRTGAVGLAPSVRDDVEAWQLAGYPPNEARAMVAFQRLGVRPASLEVSPKPTPGRDPVLFSTVADVCSQIVRLPPEEVVKVMKGPSVGPTGMAMAVAVESAPEATRAELVRAYTRSLCGT